MKVIPHLFILCFDPQEMDRVSSSALEASSSSPGSLSVADDADGSGRPDAVGVATADVARLRLDSLLARVMKRREAWVLTRCMGLDAAGGGEPVSTYALAEELGMSRQGVDRLRNKAMERLRKACEEDAEVAQTLHEVCEELSGRSPRHLAY